VSWPGIVHGVVKKFSMHTNKKMSVVVYSRVFNPNEIVGVQFADGKRRVVQSGESLRLGTQSATIDLLIRGHRGAIKLATVANGRVFPLLGVPASVSTIQLGKLTLVLVEGSRGHPGTLHHRSPCHLVECPRRRQGEQVTPARSGPDGHCYCHGVQIDPLGWTASIYGAEAPSSFTAGPLPPGAIPADGGGGQQYGPSGDVPDVWTKAYTGNVWPCQLVLDETMLNGSVETLAQCLATARGSLQPEPAFSPYATAAASGAMVGSTNDVVNPFALDAIY